MEKSNKVKRRFSQELKYKFSGENQTLAPEIIPRTAKKLSNGANNSKVRRQSLQFPIGQNSFMFGKQKTKPVYEIMGPIKRIFNKGPPLPSRDTSKISTPPPIPPKSSSICPASLDFPVSSPASPSDSFYSTENLAAKLSLGINLFI